MTDPNNFKAAWWLSNCHAQTIWPSKFRKLETPATINERIELADGDFLDLFWINKFESTPIVILLHGLGGSIHSHYIKGIIPVLSAMGLRVCLVHARSAAGVVNRLPRSYHAGETEDIRQVVHLLKQHDSTTPLIAIGYSIGGSMLLNYLHRYGSDSLINAAVAISVPYDLKESALVLNHKSRTVYQHHILSCLKQTAIKKFLLMQGPATVDQIHNIRSIYEYDQLLTAPLHGFNSADHYYQSCSAKQKLTSIQTHTLLIHAVDDPFMTENSSPTKMNISSEIELNVFDRGGHVGFISNAKSCKANYWLEYRVPKFVSQIINNFIW